MLSTKLVEYSDSESDSDVETYKNISENDCNQIEASLNNDTKKEHALIEIVSIAGNKNSTSNIDIKQSSLITENQHSKQNDSNSDGNKKEISSTSLSQPALKKRKLNDMQSSISSVISNESVSTDDSLDIRENKNRNKKKKRKLKLKFKSRNNIGMNVLQLSSLLVKSSNTNNTTTNYDITNKMMMEDICEKNKEREKKREYHQRLKELKKEETMKKSILESNKMRGKYLKENMRAHKHKVGFRERVKGIGKGDHTKNQRVNW